MEKSLGIQELSPAPTLERAKPSESSSWTQQWPLGIDDQHQMEAFQWMSAYLNDSLLLD